MATAIRTEHPHIVRKPGVLGGQPVIAGTRISVVLIARFVESGVGPDEILQTYPHLSRAAVYDAISYYFDHQDEVDRMIAESTPAAVQQRYGYEVGEKGLITFKPR